MLPKPTPLEFFLIGWLILFGIVRFVLSMKRDGEYERAAGLRPYGGPQEHYGVFRGAAADWLRARNQHRRLHRVGDAIRSAAISLPIAACVTVMG